MNLVQDFFERHAALLGLQTAAGEQRMKRTITSPEAQMAGVALLGTFTKHISSTILVFGKLEMLYLKELDSDTRQKRINDILTKQTPFIIIADDLPLLQEMTFSCEKKSIPLFQSALGSATLLSKLIFLLEEDFSPRVTCHGTLVEAFGVGVLIQGDSSVGKSEAALGLIERGHRLVADDIVRVRVREGIYLEGTGPDLTRHLMEIRGIGIINVAHLYGAVCVREDKRLDLVVKLEEWDDDHFYDRVGMEEKSCDILGIKIPCHLLPVKPGRDVVLLIETIVLNHRLKEMGYNTAKEFNVKLNLAIAQKQSVLEEPMDEKSRAQS